jgi:hypothetical protein
MRYAYAKEKNDCFQGEASARTQRILPIPLSKTKYADGKNADKPAAVLRLNYSAENL